MNILTIRIDSDSHPRIAPEIELGFKREIAALTHRLNRMEKHMSEYDDVLSQLSTTLTNVASRMQGLIDKVSSLEGSGAISAKKAAAELQPFVDHLNAIAADPSNPPPAPTDSGTGTSVPGPTSPADPSGGTSTSATPIPPA